MTNVIVTTTKKTFKFKSGHFIPDKNFLIINTDDKIYKFPWTSVICFTRDKD